MTLDEFLLTEYEDFGRGPDKYDCWGLTLAARVDLFGRDILPMHSSIHPDDKDELTRAAISVRDDSGFKECEKHKGAIATAWSGRLCLHVGIVVEADGRLWILETNRKSGPALTSIHKFENKFSKVIYYDNQ